ncbi:MAG: DNA-binding protein WhiA [Clostridia bacterium]|nr:DNA-binding protein WhiA [Clostridia bacterium]
MNFTSEIKKEIVSRSGQESTSADKNARKSSFSAFIRTSGALGVKDGIPTFFLVSETEHVAEYFTNLFSEIFDFELSVTHATMDRMSGRDKLVMQCPITSSVRVLSELGLLKRGTENFREGILPSLIKTETQKIAYIQGAFLGGGSCTLPKGNGTGYHLEVVFSERKTAWDFCKLLDEFELIVRLIERKDDFVAYIKSKETISDFLAVVGAENALKKFTAFLDKRDESNRDNRAKNCFSGNADKTAIAAVKQVVALKKLEETNFKDLSEELKQLARARLRYPEKSLRELAELLGESKSCLNHRMRKLMELAERIAD